jgi:hypothetical protein
VRFFNRFQGAGTQIEEIRYNVRATLGSEAFPGARHPSRSGFILKGRLQTRLETIFTLFPHTQFGNGYRNAM